ncbi:hypothetical protein VTI74DRAFT_5049 [Chaetomium olivicolor]
MKKKKAPMLSDLEATGCVAWKTAENSAVSFPLSGSMASHSVSVTALCKVGPVMFGCPWFEQAATAVVTISSFSVFGAGKAKTFFHVKLLVGQTKMAKVREIAVQRMESRVFLGKAPGRRALNPHAHGVGGPQNQHERFSSIALFVPALWGRP